MWNKLWLQCKFFFFFFFFTFQNKFTSFQIGKLLLYARLAPPLPPTPKQELPQKYCTTISIKWLHTPKTGTATKILYNQTHSDYMCSYLKKQIPICIIFPLELVFFLLFSLWIWCCAIPQSQFVPIAKEQWCCGIPLKSACANCQKAVMLLDPPWSQLVPIAKELWCCWIPLKSAGANYWRAAMLQDPPMVSFHWPPKSCDVYVAVSPKAGLHRLSSSCDFAGPKPHNWTP